MKVTEVAPVRLVPLRVTRVPAQPFPGDREPREGALRVKLPVDVAVPHAVVTWMGPEVAPLGTVAVISLAETTVKEAAAVPLKATEVTPVKLVPVRETTVPAHPLVGEKEVIPGATTAKFVTEMAVPHGLETRMSPVVALLGTVAKI